MRTVDHEKNIIEVRDVSFSYGHINVVSDVSFDVHKGDYLGLIGPNGGGKTTLLKIMLGLLPPTKGNVKLFGKDIAEYKEWGRIGYVPQHAVKFESNFPITVEEVVSMGLYGKKGFFNSLNDSDKEKVSEVLKSVEIQDLRKSLVGDLSGGQQQRVFIARALVSNPEVLFLDEPTVGVDIEAQEKFYELLHSLNEKYDLTLILVSHDIDVISQEATEIASINHKLVYHGTPENFLKGNHIEELYGKNLKLIGHNH